MIKTEDIGVDIHKKIPIVHNPTKNVIVKMYDWTSNIHTDIPQSTLDVMHSGIPKIYVGLHKSLWETMGVPVVINKLGLDMPYIVIGKNLVKGISKPLIKAFGCIYVERAAKDRNKQNYQSALEIKVKITKALDKGYDVLIFPVDGRTKNGETNSFFSTPFDAALDHLKNGPTKIIPFDVDYERLNDMPRMLKSIEKGKSYTFKIWHFLDWWKNLGNMYVNFGEPINIDEKTNRKKINRDTLKEAKNLVKILPVNVFSEAVIRHRRNGGYFDYTIEEVIDDLRLFENKFRGFKNIDDISNNAGLTFSEPEKKYEIYSGYIKHYLPKQD